MQRHQILLKSGLLIFLLGQPIIAVVLAIGNVNVPALLMSSSLVILFWFYHAMQGFKINFNHTVLMRGVGVLGFLMLVMASARWTIAPMTAEKKLLFWLVAVVIPCFLLLVSGSLLTLKEQAPRSVAQFQFITLSCAFYILLYLLFSFPSASGSGRMVMPGIENPIWVARFACVFTIILLFRSYKKPSRKKSIILMFLLPFIILILLQTGSRGAILALVLTIVYVFQRNTKQFILRTCLFAIGSLILASIVNFDSIARGYYSINERIALLNFVFENPTQILTGSGLGSFGMALLGIDVFHYPHNILLEIWFEVGIFALVSFIYLAIKIMLVTPHSEEKCLFVFFLIAAMFSGDLTGNAQVFYLMMFLKISKKSMRT
jgi:hypothetical protein